MSIAAIVCGNRSSASDSETTEIRQLQLFDLDQQPESRSVIVAPECVTQFSGEILVAESRSTPNTCYRQSNRRGHALRAEKLPGAV